MVAQNEQKSSNNLWYETQNSIWNDDDFVMLACDDLFSPTALCRDITVYLDGNGEVYVDALDVDNGSSDDCGIEFYDLSTGKSNALPMC